MERSCPSEHESCRFQAILDKYRSCKAGRIRRRRRGVRCGRFYFGKRKGGIKQFLSLKIDDEKAGAQMDVQEQAPIQISAKKTSKAPEKQLKITSFFK